VTRTIALAICAVVLAGCNRPAAPEDAGVCWLSRGSGASGFIPLARNIDSLENCAVLLEAHRLQAHADADGAYQGYFIFAEGAGISSSTNAQGFRYPILQPPQRAAIDRDIRKLLAERGGRLPSPGDLMLQRQ